MKEITEIDMNKYFVLKREDLDRFFSQYTKGIFTTPAEQRRMDTIPFNTVCEEILKDRKARGKTENNYIVLNLDDEIAELYLEDAIDKVHKAHFEDSRDNHRPFIKVKVKDIAVALVNAILKAKEKPR